MYDPLIILPLMVAGFIVAGSVGGGLYFDEFSSIGFRLGSSEGARALGWALYVGGILLILGGLYLIARSGMALHEAELKAALKAELKAAAAKGGEAEDGKAHGNAHKHWRTVAAVVKLGVQHPIRPSTGAHLPHSSHPLGGIVVNAFESIRSGLGLAEPSGGPTRYPPNEATPLSTKPP